MIFRTLLLTVLMFFVANPVKAWWDLGHSVICEVALEQVDAKTRHAVEALLAPNEQFGAACIWADVIKPERRETSPWHYINTDVGDTDIAEAHRPAEGDILSALHTQTAILGDCSRSHRERQEALRYVGHFVGDLHQPLHVAYKKDLGGNLYRLELPPALADWIGEQDGKTNMHAVWDGLLLVYALRQSHKSVYELMAGMPVTDNTDASAEEWANESLALLQQPELEYTSSKRLTQLNESYFQENWPKAVLRLSQASQRLAHVLEHSLRVCD